MIPYIIIITLYAIGMTYLFIRSFFGSKTKDNKIAESQKRLDILENRREEHEKFFEKNKDATVSDNDDELANTADSDRL
jgi:hypothetical protein